jgi:hypothetical protein
MNILQTEWWSVAVPPEWWADQEEESIVIGDRDDVGVIEISTLCRDEGEFSEAEVRQIASDNTETGSPLNLSQAGDFSGLATSFTEDEAAIREWYLSADGVLLFVTYSCDLENAGMDDAAVDEILDTLMLNPAED